MDLSKAFGMINYKLLLAKVIASGFDKTQLPGKSSIKSKNKQCSQFLERFKPLLFSTYLNDLFLQLKYGYICDFVDDTTLFTCDKSI